MTSPDSRVQQISAATDPWQRQRAISKAARRDFTDVLKDHGAMPPDYAICTNAAYIGSLGKSAKKMKLERGLRPRDNLRNHMSVGELAQMAFTESLAGGRIVEECCEGGEECRLATAASASWVRRCVELDKDDRKVRKQVAANDSVRPSKAA